MRLFLFSNTILSFFLYSSPSYFWKNIFMSFKIEVPPSQIDFLKEFYIERKKSIRENIQKLENDVSIIDEALEQLENRAYIDNRSVKSISDGSIVINPNGYIPKWSYPKKIKFILEMKKKPLTARQITDIIINELEIDDWANKDKKEKDGLYGTISSTLTNNSKPDKDFIKTKNEIDENIYNIKY